MTRYLIEATIAPHSFEAYLKDPQDRAEALGPVVEALGGKLIAAYFGVGQNKVYGIAEYPDDITLEAATMAMLAAGVSTSIKSTPIITSAEAVEAMKKAADIAYQPPSA